MTRNEIRYYLHNLDGLKADIRLTIDQISTFKQMDNEYIKLPVFQDGSKSTANGISNVVEMTVLKRVEHVERLQQHLSKKIIILDCLQKTLCYLDQAQQQVIHLKYFDKRIGRQNNTYESIAKVLNYSVRQVQQIESDVIDFIQRQYESLVT